MYFRDLMLFLDEVDKNCNRSLQSAKSNAEMVTKLVQSTLNLETIPR